MNATYITKDQSYQNEQTTYWFEVNGDTYGVREHPDGVSILDDEGCPINTDDAKDVYLKDLVGMVTEEMRAA